MPILDSKTLQIKKDYNLEELNVKTAEMRIINMTALCAAGSGHTGGTLSIMDIAAVLYLKQLRHDPDNPEWDDRDRVYWSVGHKAPALYVALGMAGYYDIEDTVKLRKLWSGFEGHPNRFDQPGIELSSGSLGQGLGVAVGSAIRAKLDKKDFKVYCIMGDGEQQEGSIWEAVMSASFYKLNNLVAIIDRNGLQIDGKVEDVMNIEPIEEKYQSFGWHVITTDGHDSQKLLNAFEEANKITDKPIVIIADTIKGKGVSFAENVVGYHGICPKDGRCGSESLDQAIQDICQSVSTQYSAGDKIDKLLTKAENYQDEVDKKVNAKLPKYSRNYWWNSGDKMKTAMDPTRVGFGRALKKLGEDERVVAFGADITGSIKMSDFYSSNPERKNRFFSMGIAEQNMTVVAAGMAKEGKIPFIGSYGVFSTGRNWDQIRTTICYNNYNVKILDAHAGVSVGPDGATHQALEDISNLYYLPNMHIAVPCDSIESEKSTVAITNVNGPATLRVAREATPTVTKEDSPFQFGIANVIRYRGVKENFTDAFDISLGTDYKNENENLAIIACGPIVPEAMRAAYILKEEYNIETRILNVHTVKPIDKESIVKAFNEIGVILTAEEHQVGGFGNIVAGIISMKKVYHKPYLLDMIGVQDIFGKSGQPWELMKEFALSAEFIAQKAKNLVDIKKNS